MISAAILCSRKGSKRLTNKAWLPINGIPMWHYAARAMKQALARGKVTHLMVSTDDQRMLEDAMLMGIFPVKRPDELCGDKASIHLALKHAIVEYERDAQCIGRIEAVGFVPANVPTVTADLICECVRMLDMPDATATMTITAVSQPPEWMWQVRKNSAFLRREKPGRGEYRMQALPHRYIATGTCQFVRRKTLMACSSSVAYRWLGKNIYGVPDLGAVEVHNKRDYLLAKAVIEKGKRT